MRNNIDQSIMDVPLGEMATRALNEPIEAGLVPLHVKYVDGIGAYTNVMRVMQTLDEEIALEIRQELLWERLLRPSQA